MTVLRSGRPDSDALRSIPSLDGLRALSCLLVVLAHGINSLPPSMRIQGPWAAVIFNSHLGVHVFFVISGYLITRLLLEEKHRTGTIHLGRFYLRRSLRIFPPFYVYLIVLAAATACGWLVIPARMFIAAGTYLWNYLHWSESWFLGHVWSLAVEEQFYLVWPALMLLLADRKAKWCAFGIVAASPIVRIASYQFLPESRPYISIMLHTRADALMFGCLLALCWTEPWLCRWKAVTARASVLGGMVLFLVVLSPLLAYSFRGAYLLPGGYSMEGICIATLVMYVVEDPMSRVGRCLNVKPMKAVGRMSYSIYLWQQCFLTTENILSQHPPAQFLAVCVAAAASYYVIEKPSSALKTRLAARV